MPPVSLWITFYWILISRKWIWKLTVTLYHLLTWNFQAITNLFIWWCETSDNSSPKWPLSISWPRCKKISSPRTTITYGRRNTWHNRSCKFPSKEWERNKAPCRAPRRAQSRRPSLSSLAPRTSFIYFPSCTLNRFRWTLLCIVAQPPTTIVWPIHLVTVLRTTQDWIGFSLRRSQIFENPQFSRLTLRVKYLIE